MRDALGVGLGEAHGDLGREAEAVHAANSTIGAMGGRRVKALLFDFDGTIVDSESVDMRAWEEVFEAHGRPLEDFPQGQVKYLDLDLARRSAKFATDINVPLRPFQEPWELRHPMGFSRHCALA